MALVLRDRVKETTSTAGTGTYSLAGAVVGFESFASVGNGNTTYYGCSDGTDFEVGIGTYTASGTTLARTTILQSSNSDSAVNWGSGTRTIFCTLPAEKMSFLDASGNVVAANGSALTALNASNLGSGTVANARLDAQLQDVAGLAVTNGGFIVGDGSNFVLETEGTARASLGLGTSAVLDTGISNTNVPKFTSGVADDDFLRVAGTAIEGRSASEVLSDIGAITASSSATLTNKSIAASQLTGALPAISGAALTNLPAQTDSTKMPLAGGTFTGDVTFATGKIIGPTNASGLGMDIEIPSYYGLDVIYTGGGSDEFLARFGSNAAVQLYHNGTEKFATSSSGVTVTGTLAATAVTGDGSGLTNLPASGIASVVEDTTPQLGGDLDVNSKAINFGDSNGTTTNMLTFGVGDDLKIYHHATAGTYITESGTGNLNLMAGDLRLMNGAGYTTLQSQSSGIRISNSYTLPAADGTNGQVMTTDGSGAVSFADAGGGADLYSANPDSATDPTAGGLNSVAIGNNAVVTNAGSGVNGSKSIAIGHNSSITSQNAIGAGREAAVSGAYASGFGYKATSAGTQSHAATNSYASGSNSFAAAIANNTASYGATDSNSIAMGQSAKASLYYTTAIGGYTVASGGWSTAIGYDSQATANFAMALGGQGNRASASHAIAMGDTSTASHANSVSIGDSVQSTAANQINLGGTADTVRISETYTLPTSDGSANQVLTTNGSGVVSFATAGGGADLYAANESSPNAQPSALGANAIAIGNTTKAGTQASHQNAIAIGGSNNTSQPIQATNIFAVAIGTAYYGGVTASSDGSMAIGTGATVASASGSLALGRSSTAAGNAAVSLPVSYASGANSLAAAIANSSSSYGSTASNSIAIGYRAKASGAKSIALSGENAAASGSGSFAAGGEYQTASGAYSVAIGGSVNTASGEASYAFGKRALAAQVGKYAYGAYLTSTAGATQGGMMILNAATTDATATVLSSDSNAAGSTNQIVAASDTAITFDGSVTGIQNGAQAFASFLISGLLVNDGGTTTLVNSATTVIDNQSSWVVAMAADNTNNALAITVTGEASHNIRWVANIRTSEVTYA